MIAIIAILAAILFPVFAQAKAAAKASAAMSNAKQIGIAHIMYAGDYDDTAMMGGQWFSTDADALQSGSTSSYLPWPALAEPYIKAIGLFSTPLAPDTQPFNQTAQNNCNSPRSCMIRYPQFGYNMMYMAPWMIDTVARKYIPLPVHYTAVAKPAQQVLLTEIWTRSTCPTTTAWGSTRGNGYVTFGEAPPPDKKHTATNGYGFTMPSWGHSWGNDGASLAYGTIPSLAEGKYTGGVALRVAEKTSVVFADGHVVRMVPDKLAEGTNWSTATKSMASNTIRNLKNERYLWHPDGT